MKSVSKRNKRIIAIFAAYVALIVILKWIGVVIGAALIYAVSPKIRKIAKKSFSDLPAAFAALRSYALDKDNRNTVSIICGSVAIVIAIIATNSGQKCSPSTVQNSEPAPIRASPWTTPNGTTYYKCPEGYKGGFTSQWCYKK